jgi:hypothetical protein
MASQGKPEDFDLKSQSNKYPPSPQQQSSSSSDDRLDSKKTFTREKMTVQVNSATASVAEVRSQPSKLMTTTKSSRKSSWWQTWQFWGILLVLCSGGIGYTATSMLLKLPKAQSCSKVFWPVASASMRLYCAQTLAEQQTVESLLEAIALVEELPPEHPLRKEIDRNIEKWATAILEIGETKFQEGNLDAAIAIARQIPQNVEAHKVVESQLESWNKIWTESAGNYKRVEDNLRKAQWSDAFSWAVRLTDSKNDYWATTKYSEAIDKINIAQEESMTLDKAANQLTDTNLDGLLDAISKAQSIPPESYRYENAKQILAQGKTKLLARVNNLIEQEEWAELQKVTYRIPDALGLEKQVKDWQIIANAGSSAALNTVLGLEDAITEVQKLEPNSPLLATAEKLSKRWKVEINDVKNIAKAEELAKPGTIGDYKAAIIAISQIPPNNPRYAEAQQKAAGWRGEIQIIEDRPIIERAKELAIPSNRVAWQRAISEINLVSSSSPLYSEAQENARTWQGNIEREEDQPILDRANALGNAGDYEQAIDVARPIANNRALSAQAKEKIAFWRSEIQAEQNLEEAEYLATQNTADSLARAIEIVRKIPPSSRVYYEVVPNVNEWSQQILNFAINTSYSSLEEAIAIAGKIPAGTANYDEARNLIQEWKLELNPPPFIEKREKPLRNGIELEKTEKEFEENL